jgi:hypothetical protein
MIMRLIALVAFTLLFCRTALALDLFLSPAGNDSANGASAESAIATLARAHDLVAAALAKPPQDVTIRVAPGTYTGQTVVWRATSPDVSIVITGPDNPATPAIFDGNKQGTTFFALAPRTGAPTNLTLSNLTITDYRTAVTFAGSSSGNERWSSNNRLLNNRFLANGGTAVVPMGRSTAIVRLVNSRQNMIAGNVFDGMKGKDCKLLHAIYLAHGSSRNVITDNEFLNGCGDPIRVRDRSNQNLIYDNRFDRVGNKAAYTEWYCTSRTRCRRDECPPAGNEFFNNSLGTNFDGKPLRAFFNFKGEPRGVCPILPDDQTGFREFGNSRAN